MYEPREARRCGSVALMVLYVPICVLTDGGQLVVGVVQRDGARTVSISMTVLNPFSDRLEIGARKFPAAPAARRTGHQLGRFCWTVGGRTRRRVGDAHRR